MALPPRSKRSIEVADHLWTVLETMSLEMSTDVAALINQALFALARQNGYLTPGSMVAAAHAERSKPETMPHSAPSSPTMIPRSVPAEPFEVPPQPPRSTPGGPVPKPEKAKRDDSKSRPGRNKAAPTAVGAIAPPVKPASPDIDYLPGEISGSQPRIEGLISEVLDDTRKPSKTAGRKLFIFIDSREPTEVTPGRFIMGRDQSCNLTLLSSRISRQHAVITRDGPTYFLEDLGSSNGTWFNMERISKRPISDGEKYTLGDIVLQFAFR